MPHLYRSKMLLEYKVLHLLHPDVQMPVKYNPMQYNLLLQMLLEVHLTGKKTHLTLPLSLIHI